MYIFSSEDGYLELACVVKVPIQLLRENGSLRRYKYHVESPLTQTGSISSWEFIAGINTRSGSVIDRSLRLHIEVNMIQSKCKLIYVIMHVYIYNVFIYEGRNDIVFAKSLI